MSNSRKQLVAIGGFIVLALPVILGVMQIIDWFTKPTISLHATVSFAPIQYPPTLKKEFETLSEKLDVTNLEKLIDWPSITDDESEADRLRPRFNRELSALSWKLMDDGRIPSSVSDVRGVYWINLANDSTIELSKVQLTIPDATMAQVEQADDRKDVQVIDGIIRFDEMQAQEVKDLLVWSKSSLGPTSIAPIRLTHRDGIGNVKIDTAISSIPTSTTFPIRWIVIVSIAYLILFWYCDFSH